MNHLCVMSLRLAILVGASLAVLSSGCASGYKLNKNKTNYKSEHIWFEMEKGKWFVSKGHPNSPMPNREVVVYDTENSIHNYDLSGLDSDKVANRLLREKKDSIVLSISMTGSLARSQNKSSIWVAIDDKTGGQMKFYQVVRKVKNREYMHRAFNRTSSIWIDKHQTVVLYMDTLWVISNHKNEDKLFKENAKYKKESCFSGKHLRNKGLLSIHVWRMPKKELEKNHKVLVLCMGLEKGHIRMSPK